ncbi:MAG: electron transport complex subunit RsxA [Spirochaetales bacterium]|jgi:electron transport complex protein RnfA|nr:electron transport complex subunit RsxA [Spirochaetales bacterium]
MSYIGIIVSFVFAGNIILSQLLVGKAFIDMTRNMKSAFSFGLVLSCVAALSCLATWILYRGILEPFGLGYLQTLTFILVITGLTLILEFFFEKLPAALRRRASSLLPLVSTNCAVLGLCLISVRSGYSALESLTAGAAAGVGYFLTLFLLSTMREAMKKEWIPRPFRGVPITLISAGLMALAFMAFDEALLKNLLG